MGRNARGQFEPGTSGNVKGRPAEDEVRADGWASAFTGLGMVGRDKRLTHSYQGSCLGYQEVAAIWEKDGIAAKAIEAPSAEAFREGYELTMGDEDHEDVKEDLQDALEDLEADEAIEQAWQYMRAYGAGMILLGTNDTSKLEQPLDLSKVRDLEYLTVFEPMELVPEDPSASLRDYGKAQYYRINNGGSTLYAGSGEKSAKVREQRPKVMSRIHASRLLVFNGIRTSRYLPSKNPLSQLYGNSVVDRFIDSLRDCGVGFQSAALLATDVGQPVITIQNLHQMVAKNNEAFKARMQGLELGRSTARAIFLDAEKEKFERQMADLGGIPDLLDRLSIYMCANVGVPLSVLFGYSPSSLGQPGEVELKFWYNAIRTLQRRKFGRVLKKIAKLKLKGMRQRKLPRKIGVEWFELERLNELQQSEARLNTARAIEIKLKYGVLHPDEVRKSLYTGRYSHDIKIDTKKKAPGYVAVAPKGVAGAAGAPGGAASPGAHTVGGYARRDPVKRDSMSDLLYAIEKLEKARAAGADEKTLAALAYVAEYEREAEALAHEAGECESGCELCTHADEDGAGQHVSFMGMQVCIESPRGSTRSWIDTDGTPGTTTMQFDYGYVVGSRGSDGDSVDVYLGPNPSAQWVYVVHQQSKASGFTTYDEDKVMLGFDSAHAAVIAYGMQYDDARFFGGLTMMTLEDFRLKMFASPGDKITA